LITAAVERLRARHPIEYDLVTGIPHAEALERYKRADLVIDQTLAGWYGGLAVEAMAMGKPVAAYIRDEDLGVVPAAMRAELPIVRITPATIEQDLEAAIAQRDQWAEWGSGSREFVLRWHHPAKLARQLLRVYENPGTSLELG
jgi:glycosyltransferase involved in cell wall biosynthesis